MCFCVCDVVAIAVWYDACVCLLLYVAGTGQEVQWPTRKEMVVCNQATEKGMWKFYAWISAVVNLQTCEFSWLRDGYGLKWQLFSL